MAGEGGNPGVVVPQSVTQAGNAVAMAQANYDAAVAAAAAARDAIIAALMEEGDQLAAQHNDLVADAQIRFSELRTQCIDQLPE